MANGRYSIVVLGDAASSGCGGANTKVVLWTFAHNATLYSTSAVAWPGTGHTKEFTARFSTSTPAGAAPTTAEFVGGAYGRDGRPLPPGTRVEAFVGASRCGVASVRSADTYTGYILAVVGPDSIRGCTRGATLTFRINGDLAADVAVVNTPPGQQDPLDLTLR